jgi:GT2 family glycosyltransferase
LINWRAPEMTLRAVEAVFDQTHPPDHVFVVENGSGDGSADFLRAALDRWPNRASLLVNERNLGFGGGCNPAIEAARAGGFSHIWLLNNDATPAPNCLEALLDAALQARGRLGAVGSLLVDPSGGQAPHFGSWMRPAALTCGSVEAPHDLKRPYAWCTAASLLLDVQAIAEVGAFDEGFFMYWEDADLNLRLRNAGYEIVCAPGARVLHEAGSSSASIPVQRYIWHFTSQRRFLRKHHRHTRSALLWLRWKFLLKALLDRDLPRFRALVAQR